LKVPFNRLLPLTSPNQLSVLKKLAQKDNMKKECSSKTASATLSSSVNQYIKDAIVKNKIKPKERIREKEIAGLFNYIVHSQYQKRFLKLHKELIGAIEAKDIPRLRRVIKNHWVTFP